MEGGQAKPRARYVRAGGDGEAGGGWEVASWPTLLAVVLGLALGLAGTITGSWAVHRALTHDANDRAWVADYVQFYTEYHAAMTQFLAGSHCQALKNAAAADASTACEQFQIGAEAYIDNIFFQNHHYDWSGLSVSKGGTSSMAISNGDIEPPAEVELRKFQTQDANYIMNAPHKYAFLILDGNSNFVDNTMMYMASMDTAVGTVAPLPTENMNLKLVSKDDVDEGYTKYKFLLYDVEAL